MCVVTVQIHEPFTRSPHPTLNRGGTAMKIGVLGSGGVAKALGSGFLKHGHEVVLGTRSPAKLAEWAGKQTGTVAIGSFAEAAKFGEVLVLAVKGKAAADALRMAGA